LGDVGRADGEDGDVAGDSPTMSREVREDVGEGWLVVDDEGGRVGGCGEDRVDCGVRATAAPVRADERHVEAGGVPCVVDATGEPDRERGPLLAELVGVGDDADGRVTERGEVLDRGSASTLEVEVDAGQSAGAGG